MSRVFQSHHAERVAIGLEAWKLLSVSGTELIRLRFQTGEALPAHRNPMEVIFHVLHGSGELSIENEQFSMASGDSAHVLPDAMRSWKNTGNEALDILVIKRM